MPTSPRKFDSSSIPDVRFDSIRDSVLARMRSRSSIGRSDCTSFVGSPDDTRAYISKSARLPVTRRRVSAR